MRYVKPPKILSSWAFYTWGRFPRELASIELARSERLLNIKLYIENCSHNEYIVDARVFRSELVSELLN